MDSTAQSEDTAALVVDKDPPMVTSAPGTNENTVTPAPVVDTKPLAVSDISVAVDCVEAVVAVAEVVIDTDGSCNSAPVEDDKLNEAMASTTISTSDSTDVKQNHCEAIVEDQVSDTIAKENIVVDNNIVKPHMSEKAQTEPDKATDGEFKNARESIVNEVENVGKVQQCDINQQECFPSGESSGEDELADEEDVGDEEGAEVRNYNIIYVNYTLVTNNFSKLVYITIYHSIHYM